MHENAEKNEKTQRIKMAGRNSYTLSGFNQSTRQISTKNSPLTETVAALRLKMQHYDFIENINPFQGQFRLFQIFC